MAVGAACLQGLQQGLRWKSLQFAFIVLCVGCGQSALMCKLTVILPFFRDMYVCRLLATDDDGVGLNLLRCTVRLT